MRSSPLLLVLLVNLLPACTSSSDDESQHMDLVSVPYTLQPGEEKYFCYTARMPMDREVSITKLTPTYGPGTHHLLVAQTLATEPEGFSECNVLIRNTWVPLYGGGVDSGVLQLPENTGFKLLEKGQQILMQLHLQNATDQTITGTTKMRMDYVDTTPELVTASIFGMDNRKISVPPHSTGVMTSMSCPADKDLNVFAVMGHMHKHGQHMDLSRGATPGADMIYEEEWRFEQQPITPMTFHVAKGEQLNLRCTHKNEGDQPVIYGESSDTEMCSFVLYTTPAATLDGCISE